MLYLLLLLSIRLFGGLNLEEHVQDFIWETRRIEIEDHPYAFNPSMVRWEDCTLMTFREILDENQEVMINSAGSSALGILLLDDDFRPVSAPQMLNHPSGKPLKAEDARVIEVGEKLYILFSCNENEVITEGGFRMYAAELEYDGSYFSIKEPVKLEQFEGESALRREKNWVPFDYQGHLLLSYTISPHIVFYPLLDDGVCDTFAKNQKWIDWDFGEIRGGTPALLLDGSRYIAFFHSCQEMSTQHSDDESVLHYFMGAYTFSACPPFEVTHFSPEPIVGERFYKGPIYNPYWKPVRVVFPCGLMIDDNFIWVSYGRQDHEIWIAKIDKKGLLESLKSLSYA